MEISREYAIGFEPRFSIVLTRIQSNIFVDASGHARITDFGLATVTQNLDSIRSASDDQGHTARWTAPEILNEQGTYSKEADVFALAMVMIEVSHEWVIFIELCLPPSRTTRCLLAQFHLMAACRQWLCLQ